LSRRSVEIVATKEKRKGRRLSNSDCSNNVNNGNDNSNDKKTDFQNVDENCVVDNNFTSCPNNNEKTINEKLWKYK